MAVTKTDQSSVFTLETTNLGGKKISKTIQHLNPSATDDKTYYFANKYASLQKDTLTAVQRTDKCYLTQEEP